LGSYVIRLPLGAVRRIGQQMGSSIFSVRVLTSSKKKIENGTELVTTIEVLCEDGVKCLADGLLRVTETDKSMSLVASMLMRNFAAHQDTSPSETNLITTVMDTVKGEVEGDHRWDTVEMTTITKEGIHKGPAQRRKRSLAQHRTELSEKEAMDRVAAFLNLREF
jgi:hypothetical protein